MIVKRTDASDGWPVYHRSIGATTTIFLNATSAQQGANSAWWNNTTPTSTVFTVGNDDSVNANGGTYVAYLFAHNAGGFGLSGNDNVISCGSYTGNGSGNGPEITLGYEPQWVMIKRSDGTGNWHIFDSMRGMSVAYNNATPEDAFLRANTSDAEVAFNNIRPTQTGFAIEYADGTQTNASGGTYIYIAIRRGPMKTPTTGTSVFTPATRTGTGTTGVVVTNANFPIDLVIGRSRADAPPVWIDRLRGATVQLRSDNTDAEAASTIMSSLASQNGWIGSTGGSGAWNASSVNYIQWYMRRAPGFFDEVCYTGTGSTPQVVPHNLQVAPQLIINKSRSATGDWHVYAEPLGNGLQVRLNVPFAAVGTSRWGDTNPTATQFTIGAGNTSGVTFVAYLFASAPGVSKVGGYTGTGTTQVINCGFTTGARFVLIKRTDSDTGDWYVWDSARGIVAGNDPYLLLNSTAAEVTNTDFVDTAATGFEITSTAPAAINASGGTFIYLAIA
jgi:hypothetical protein